MNNPVFLSAGDNNKVSIIIPVYNTEKYLERCLDSVCNQTLKDIEIICIDDASTDKSYEILSNYACKDKRIRIISFRENKGAGAARNAGITAATGEYLGFVDSDDFVDLDFYEKLYAKAKETDADITKGAYRDELTGFIDIKINENIQKNKNNFCSTFCSAIYKNSLINENKIKFPLLRDMEDPVFAFSCALKANKIEIVNNTYITITKRNDSITGNVPNLKQVKDKIKGLKILYSLDLNCEYPYVLAYWIITVVLDSIKCTNFEIAQYVLYQVSQLYEKAKDKNNLNVELLKIDKTLGKFFSNVKIDYFFDRNKLKKEIDKHAVISFDIFDTLLLRPFIEPKDVFRYLGKYIDNPQYSINRIFSENKARIIKTVRNKSSEDITIDEIYSKMNPDFSNLKETEMDIEKQSLICNKEMLEIYNYALEHGKKIIITSDMYLSTEFLETVLKKNAYNNFEKIYVSSDIGKSKGSGNLYKYILKDLNISESDVLHIGDNYIADVKKPKELGIDSFWYKKAVDCFFENPKNYYLKDYYEKSANKAQTSLLCGLRLINSKNNSDNTNYWYQLGYNYGGPLIAAFLSNINKIAQVRGLSDLFFVARDSYMLYKIYNELKAPNSPKAHYVYASRRLRKLCMYSSSNSEYSEETAEEYLKYTKSIDLKGSSIGIIDTCAGAFSAQDLIETYFKNINFIGVYLATHMNYKYNYINLSGCSNTEPKELGFKWDIIEFLLASFEPPVENLKDLGPVYRENLTKEDKDKINAYKHVVKGEEAFIKDYMNLFKNYNITFNIKDMFQYISAFWNNMNGNDIKMLNSIKNPVDADQKEYISLTDNFRIDKTRAVQALLSIT